MVTLSVNGDVDLPANAVAKIQQSSLLGEKYVELAAPGQREAGGQAARRPAHPAGADQPQRRGRGAARRPVAGPQRRRAGPAADDQPRARRARCRAGRPRVRSTLTELDTFIGGLDAQKAEINRALDSVNTLAGTLAARTATIDTALDTIGPGPGRASTSSATCSCRCCRAWPGSATSARGSSTSPRPNTVADLKLLQPILTQLAAAGPNLAGSLDLLLTYPFPASSVIGAGNADQPLNYRQDQRTGGYALFTNMTATVELDLTQTLCRYVDRPGDRRAEDLRPERHPGRHLRPARHPARATRPGPAGGSGAPAPSDLPDAARRHRRPGARRRTPRPARPACPQIPGVTTQ